MASGIQITAEVKQKFNSFKLSKDRAYFVCGISGLDAKGHEIRGETVEVVVLKEGKKLERPVQKQVYLDEFQEVCCLLDDDTPYFVFFDFYFEEEGSPINKLCLMAWSPDSANIKKKMLYSTTRETLKKTSEGLARVFQLNDKEDLNYEELIKQLKRNK